MPNELPIPDDLSSLIEKREQSDRRESERRTEETGEPLEIEADQRTGQERREESRRDD